MSDQIYIPLLDEGTSVWRPAPAWKIDRDTYIVLRPDDYDPDNEHWQFPPGCVVVCEQRQTAQGTIVAAVRAKSEVRQSA